MHVIQTSSYQLGPFTIVVERTDQNYTRYTAYTPDSVPVRVQITRPSLGECVDGVLENRKRIAKEVLQDVLQQAAQLVNRRTRPILQRPIVVKPHNSN